jgi:prevent-host-death family protein
MCYMKNDVGVRELRQNLSKYLRRVTSGSTLRVLDRGRPVAVLAPLPDNDDALDRMVRERRAIPATRDLLEIEPLSRRRSGPTLTRTLEDSREERLP